MSLNEKQREEFIEKSSHSLANGGFLEVEPPEGFVAMVDNQWNWFENLLDTHTTKAVEDKVEEIWSEIPNKKFSKNIREYPPKIYATEYEDGWNDAVDAFLDLPSLINNKQGNE